MSDIKKVEVSSFLEVPADAFVVIKIDGVTYDIGYVKRIHATSDNYVVWEDDEDRIWYESINKEIIKTEDFHKFWNQYQIASCRPMHNIRKKSTYPYLRILSSAISSALEGQFMAAAEAIDSAAVVIKTANERVSRRRYTTGAITSLIVFLSISALFSLSSSQPQSLAFLAQISMLGGSLGAVLSALAERKGGLGFDPGASRLEGVLNGALRVVYGVISAFVVVIVITSGIVSTPLVTTDNQPLSLIAVAVAGGFAERWAANMIQRFSSSAEQRYDRTEGEK